MKAIMKSMKLVCLFLAFACLIDYSLGLNNYNYIRYLEEKNPTQIKITYEFPFSCGNSYITGKKICNDITNELIRRNLNVEQNLVGKNISSKKSEKLKDTYFNIYMEYNYGKYLLATTNPNSKFYSENLASYPERFVKFAASPRDDDFTKKFEIVRVLQQRIIDNL